MAMKERSTQSKWVDNLLRPVLIASMLACILAPLVKIIEWLVPTWQGTYALVFAFFAGLEGILSERALQRRGIGGYGYLISRGAELLILLLLLKLASYLSLGLDQLWADALRWSTDLNQFLSVIDLYLVLLFIPLWAGAIYMARVVRELDVEEEKESPPPDKTSPEYYLWLTRPHPLSNRQEILDRLGEFFVWGGVVILLASMLIHFLVASAESLLIPTMLYFALGIALLSQGQFSVLRASWQIQSIPIQQNIGRRWLLWAILFLVIVALIASLLPATYALGPLQALRSLFALLFNLLSFLIFFLFFLITLPLALLLPDFERPDRPELDLVPLAPFEPATSGGPPAWLQIVLSAIFWAVMLAIVGYALVRFLRDRFSLLPEEGEAAETWWMRFLVWLRDLWRRWWTWQQDLQSQRRLHRAARRAERSTAPGPRHFFFPGRLPPRELVRYFYLSATRRAAQAGQSRQPDQTPYEYRIALDRTFPDLEPDLTDLTEAFVKARYSPHVVEQEEADGVKPLWQRIKAALRRRRANP
jgi:hypothetical protein